MPNTKSAERRMRNSSRKHLNNQSWKSRIKTVERSFIELLDAGRKDDAALTLKKANSTLDKAAKTGVIHPSTASRKKSRLALRLNRAKTSPVSEPKAG